MRSKVLPLLTICMPTKNRAWLIDRILKAVELVDYPKDRIKLAFVDDFSGDGTFEKLLRWRERVRNQYYDVVVVQKRTNIPQARNLCIKYAEGKYILYWDSDVIPPRTLLMEMVSLIENNSSIGVIGADYTYEHSLKIRYKPVTGKETHAVYMGFTLIRRKVIELIGGFNEKLSVGEDTEFCIRVKERTKYKVLWAPKTVLHLKRPEDVMRRGLLRAWLKYNYDVRAKEYYESFRDLPRFLKARIFYYAGLPWAMALGLIASIIDYIFLLLVLIYLAPSLYLAIRQRGFTYGILTWLTLTVPTGLALSYGVTRVALKNRLKALGKPKD